MGAAAFVDFGYGYNPEQIFKDLIKEAQWNFGHAGYTGTIAEKDDFVDCNKDIPKLRSIVEAAGQEFPEDDLEQVAWLFIEYSDNFPSFYSKWGPAGYIHDDDEHVFFGFASS